MGFYRMIIGFFFILFIGQASAANEKDYQVLLQSARSPDQIHWETDTSGVKMTVLHPWDPETNEPYMRLFQAVDGFVNYPHIHNEATYLYVVSGELHIGFGPTFDKEKSVTLPAGGAITIPAKQAHYEWFDGPTVMVSTGLGDRKTIYVNDKGEIRKVQSNTLYQAE